MTRLRFENARLVLEDGVETGGLAVEDGRIAALDPQGGGRGKAIDLDGDLLLPGLVDLHTDNLERHYLPRRGVTWDPIAAAVAHDAQIAASGTTTVFDSLTIGANEAWDIRAEMIDPMLAGLRRAEASGMLKVGHRLHLRCEVTHPDVVGIFEGHAARVPVHLVSLMDHAPGDRQSPDIDAYRRRYRRILGDEARVEAHINALIDASRRFAPDNARRLGALAGERRIPLATHDDASPGHVDLALGLGARFSEFPTTLAAAAHAKAHGLPVLMGTPNLMRGGSHAGNVAAGELARYGLLDLLASDYVPASLLNGVFRLADPDHGVPLHEAAGMATSAPARAAGLADRGSLAPGLRADLVRVRPVGGYPVVRGVWCAGSRVA
ncbi:MAG: alpha-D-ribose 1-methylphosphonate 5-triphosphate diphosphatase [Geminicoccaceae bacterium]|nr:alpha-D-ribose 1-methylphosphonate 5-triphosphate diphosphatase [Geminicoccaceae bacterium]